MFRIESSTSYDGPVVRHLRDVDGSAALLASRLAVFLEERLGMMVEVVYSTGFNYYGKPSAMCEITFPMVGHSIPRFLVFENLKETATPDEWLSDTTDAEFFERMLKEAASSLQLVLPQLQHQLDGYAARVEQILAETEQAVPA
ncbi:MAG: hypothetical protein HYS45_03240 [Parcubacteria group bacterium]|nr:hypothetical protein [Parcubacteria group bacterium]